MMHKYRLVLLLATVAVIIAVVIVFWYLQPKTDRNQANSSDTNLVSQKLSADDYQQKVTQLLSEVISAPSDSLPIVVAKTADSLQHLVVSEQVKNDHLALFIAFDTWHHQPQNIAAIKGKLQTFAKDQVWSASYIQSVMAKFPSS